MKELIKAYEAYINLLCEELRETVGLAIVHGWKSDRVEEGKKARQRIDEAKKKLRAKNGKSK